MQSKFEDFLKEWHANHYHGTDDDMPDDFNHWISGQDVSDIIDLADIAILEAERRGIERGGEIALNAMQI